MPDRDPRPADPNPDHTYEHHPLCDDDGWDHVGPCVVELCAWWARCDNVATKTRPHPILADVPICDRCDDLVEGLS